jgi:hypothetical protein
MTAAIIWDFNMVDRKFDLQRQGFIIPSAGIWKAKGTISWVESHTTVNYNFFVSVGIGFPVTDFNVFKHTAPRKG